MSERVIARLLSIFSATEEDTNNNRLFTHTSRPVGLTWQVSSQGKRDLKQSALALESRTSLLLLLMQDEGKELVPQFCFLFQFLVL